MSQERIRGVRAALFFQPQILSQERMCAGVVLRLDDGRIATRVAIQPQEAQHAFGVAGEELHAIAHHLCLSLVEHLTDGLSFESWTAPFENASIDKLGRVEGARLESLLDVQVSQNSTLFTLFKSYEMPAVKQYDSIVKRVRKAIMESKSHHLADRFHRELPVTQDALPLKVEFLGANYACYFLQISPSLRGIEESARRAHGKLFELQNVRSHFAAAGAGDSFEEVPRRFELLVIGDHTNPIQKSAWLQIESLADSNNLVTRILESPAAAANAVARFEHLMA
jgi:hypothetical protein